MCGKLPFCAQCRQNNQKCDYYYRSMNYKEISQFYAECQDEDLKRKVRELRND